MCHHVSFREIQGYDIDFAPYYSINHMVSESTQQKTYWNVSCEKSCGYFPASSS